MNSTKNQQQFASLSIIQLAGNWKKQLLYIGIISIVLSVVFSMPFFITPMYKSTAIIYPVNLKVYSTESETEQLLQLYESDEIKKQLIVDFNLYKHYKIDSTGKTARTEVLKQMASNITVNKTDYESVKLEVLDSDTLVAKQIADSIISKADRLEQKLYRKIVGEQFIIAQNQFDSKKKELDSLDNALKELRKQTGIFDFAQQTRSLSKEYYKGLATGKTGNGNSKLDVAWNNFAEYGGQFVTLNEHINRTRAVYNDYKQYVENAKKDLQKELSYSNVVTLPEVPDKKAYPVRWLIVLMFTASVLFLSFISIVVYENYNKTSSAKA
jgi:capsule polysaccharide export protein KpsE/RkpR